MASHGIASRCARSGGSLTSRASRVVRRPGAARGGGRHGAADGRARDLRQHGGARCDATRDARCARNRRAADAQLTRRDALRRVALPCVAHRVAGGARLRAAEAAGGGGARAAAGGGQVPPPHRAVGRRRQGARRLAQGARSRGAASDAAASGVAAAVADAAAATSAAGVVVAVVAAAAAVAASSVVVVVAAAAAEGRLLRSRRVVLRCGGARAGAQEIGDFQNWVGIIEGDMQIVLEGLQRLSAAEPPPSVG
eukprot:scaffold2768_cov314-Prasinococcus_capsulatus_cf.AAC.10